MGNAIEKLTVLIIMIILFVLQIINFILIKDLAVDYANFKVSDRKYTIADVEIVSDRLLMIDNRIQQLQKQIEENE